MRIKERLLRKLVTAVDNYNIILTQTSEWHGEGLIMNNARISGDVIVGKKCKLVHGVTIKAGSPVRIGSYTSINGPNTDVHSKVNSVTIGNFCSIARNVSIQEFNHRMDRLSSYFAFQNIFDEPMENDIVSNGPVEIGHDVWIGAHSVILSGTKINNGVVVAANSVVMGEVPPYVIVGGSPAKVIRYRFDEALIQRLQELRWWDWPLDRIKANRQLFEGKLTMEKLDNVGS